MKQKQNQKVSADQLCFISEEMKDLPSGEQTILTLHFWHNYTLEEIAFICDLPQTLVEKLFAEAIHRLRLNYLIEFSIPKNTQGHELNSLEVELCST